MVSIFFSEKFFKIINNNLLHINIIAIILNCGVKSTVSYVDVESEDVLSFSPLKKLLVIHDSYLDKGYYGMSFNDFQYEPIPEFWMKYRTKIKLGRFVKKILSEEVNKRCIDNSLKIYSYRTGKNIDISNIDKHIEEFVHIFMSIYKKLNNKDFYRNIEIVNGEKIRKWYLEYNYSNTIGTLGKSCMRFEKCQNFLDIYVDNPDICSLLIFKENDGKISMRALLWTLPNGEKYLDRIYSIEISDSIILVNYAKENNWLHYDKNYITTEEEDKLYLNINKTYDYYPYMDTFKYLDTENMIYSTKPKKDYCLELTSQEGFSEEYIK